MNVYLHGPNSDSMGGRHDETGDEQRVPVDMFHEEAAGTGRTEAVNGS